MNDLYELAPTLNINSPSQQPRRIHILGVGNVGTFVAHSLAGIPNRPPITLLLKGVDHFKAWKKSDETLSVITRGMTEKRKGFDVELCPYEGPNPRPYQSSTRFPRSTQTQIGILGELDAPKELSPNPALQGPQASQPKVTKHHQPTSDEGGKLLNDFDREVRETRSHHDSIILHLIVTTRAAATAGAIKQFAHRLNSESSILFLQNGIGVLDEINQICFPDPSSRPQYLVGVNSHGLKRQGMFFDVKHTREGSIALGTMPQPFFSGIEHQPTSLISESQASQYLIRTMTRTPVLVCGRYRPTDLFQLQLDKLAIDSVVGPLTALLDVRSGVFNESFRLTRVLRLLLAETCHVMRNMPELKNVPNVNMRFDTARVETKLWEYTRYNAENDSFMLQDLRATHQTEIKYVNGYIIKRGEQLGMFCIMNYMLMQLVHAKCSLLDIDKQRSVPLAP